VQLVWLAESGRGSVWPGFRHLARAQVHHHVWLQDLLTTNDSE
jgi:hypothetical protein